MGKIKQECNAIIHGTIVSHDQIASRKRVAACVEKIGRIKAEIESRSKDVNESRKADLIRRIKIAQVAAKKRKHQCLGKNSCNEAKSRKQESFQGKR